MTKLLTKHAILCGMLIAGSFTDANAQFDVNGNIAASAGGQLLFTKDDLALKDQKKTLDSIDCQKNIADNLENIGYCKDGCESIYNICIMEDVQTILAAGCGASTKLYDGKNVSRVINYKYPYEYISRFALMNERKRDIENFFEEKLTLA